MNKSGKPVKVGVIGCGMISDIYLRVCSSFDNLEVVAVADRHPDRAQARAAQHGIGQVVTVEELLADREVEIVLNLTTAPGHAPIALAALEAGKHVYNEKPLTIRRTEAQQMLALAGEKGLLFGCAPDTFLGAGLQTCRRLLDEGAIGEPVAATAFFAYGGPEIWHPNPDAHYKTGSGPMFEMGPYYLTALVTLLGPIARVSGSTRMTYAERTIRRQPRTGERIPVEVPTHVTGLLDFASGPLATLVTSFDIAPGRHQFLEINGSQGNLVLPDPNYFGGPVYLQKLGQKVEEVPLDPGYSENSRGLGVADMAYALQEGRPHRASGKLAHHVLDTMHALHESSDEGHHIQLASTCDRPAPLVPSKLNE